MFVKKVVQLVKQCLRICILLFRKIYSTQWPQKKFLFLFCMKISKIRRIIPHCSGTHIQVFRKKVLGHIRTFLKAQFARNGLKFWKNFFLQKCHRITFYTYLPWTPVIFYKKHHHCYTLMRVRSSQTWNFSLVIHTWRKPRESKLSLKQSTVAWSFLPQLNSLANFVQGRNLWS
jgi:hypothetical protein